MTDDTLEPGTIRYIEGVKTITLTQMAVGDVGRCDLTQLCQADIHRRLAEAQSRDGAAHDCQPDPETGSCASRTDLDAVLSEYNAWKQSQDGAAPAVEDDR